MISDVLKASRMNMGFTQEEIAKRVKVAKQTYLKWENGDTEPKASQIKLLAENLRVTADEICNGELYTRYDLDDFIMEQMASEAPKDVITLRTWQQIPNHEKFINSLREKDLQRRKYDLESAKNNYQQLKDIMTQENREKMLEAIDEEEKQIREMSNR
ncbi:hypothetical protein JS84_21115 [Vibrio vulnificus]|uniref:helix-turn-helix domain-containing protein n=1 Tax=Vibrio vulnificus TaxID=672 RepID=UPI00037D1F26|nr:helix-turn-helix domain-containing protein [Vibrio vulnificus]EWS66814.1 XRE family transcriptional regulator [Vibrio vulnificus BAA87]KFK57318.1 hypothetical protein JS83_24580 [Vibrio vulnificus]KFK62596.1 hypothetical protein JS84_21115 [Vibrio vulnificus]KFK67772.1 hypothetical protein JS85_18140 [Vibrio vulnificus]KOR95157.1 hypothetical protein LO82_21790 [Vibrio vulnificus]